MGIQLQVNTPRGGLKIINLCDNEEQLKKITVRQLKEKMNEELKIDDDFRIVFGPEMLEEDKLLVSYGIRHRNTVHTVLRIPGGGDGGMGDREGKNRSMERLSLF